MDNIELQAMKRKIEELYPSSSFSFAKIPCFDHCVGTGKLLGEYYGQALSESLLLYDCNKIDLLNRLCLFLRSYVVIDDFLKDTPESRKLSHVITHWLKNIEDEIIYLIHQLGGDSVLWKKYHNIYQSAYYAYDFSNPFRSTMNKCSFVFLPFDLHIFKNEGEDSRNIKKFFKNFLFSLQLLDDFKDMGEDRLSPKNHNLYTAKLTDEFSNLAEKYKSYFLPSVLNLIRTGLGKFENANSSKIITTFRVNSLNWVSKYCFKLHPPENIVDNHFSSLDSWKFLYDDYIAKIRGSLSSNKIIKFNINEISAESMHTIQ